MSWLASRMKQSPRFIDETCASTCAPPEPGIYRDSGDYRLKTLNKKRSSSSHGICDRKPPKKEKNRTLLVAFQTNDWAPPDRMTGQWEVEARKDDRGGEKQKEKFLRKNLNPGSAAPGTLLCRHGYDATVRVGFPLGVTLRRAVVADEPVPVASSVLSLLGQTSRVATLVGFLTTMLMIPLSKLEPQAAHRNRRQTPSNLSAVLSKKC
ncbi:Amino-acid permease BAT1 [Frankliniella fusca]|uniref:Amino-acid permease BAT1 n=1 Tax=Frankliniella fusca TaxID=407009 RepID=A0AAE1LSF2_9NEOP|nr:Amino-acid permease BAT1 [Frankliniella fusca]